MNDRNELQFSGKVTNVSEQQYDEDNVKHITFVTKDGHFFNADLWNNHDPIEKNVSYTILGKVKQSTFEKDGKKINTYKFSIDRIEKNDTTANNEKEINNIILEGSVVRSIVKTVNSSIVNDITIANNYYTKNDASNGYDKRTNYFDVTVWGELKEQLRPGNQVVLSGRFVQDTWEYEGKKYTKFKVVADDFAINHEKEKEIKARKHQNDIEL